MAKAAAMHDIAEYHKQLKEGRNYLPFHREICEFCGITPPDFRKFNGGHNKKVKK